MTEPVLRIESLGVHFKERPLLEGISLQILPRTISTILGPSGSGKSTLLRAINRLLEDQQGFQVDGTVQFQGRNVRDAEVDKYLLRRQIGIVFQKPVIFPISIQENVLFGASAVRRLPHRVRPALAEKYLREVGLWDEVSDRLSHPALELSIGQQQRLAIARTLAVDPEIILMDEPTSALDPAAARTLEELILEIKQTRTIVLVTHDWLLAERISDQIVHLRVTPGKGSTLEKGTIGGPLQ
jgi:phosphate transport system ATP-binding protein